MTQQAMPREYVRKVFRASWLEANSLLVRRQRKRHCGMRQKHKIPYRTLKRNTESDNFAEGSPGLVGSFSFLRS